MSVTVSVAGVNYTIPQTKERGWGANVTSWIQAISSNTLQKNGGNFTLTANTNFGTSFGLLAKYFTSVTPNAAASGVVRLANTESVAWRNAGNSADLLLTADASNNLNYGGTKILLSGAVVDADVSGSAALSYAKLATIASNTILGNNTGGSATPTALTTAQVNTLLGSLSNPMSAVGDVIYGGASGLATRLAPNPTTTKKFLTQTGTGAAGQAPGWNTIVDGDLPTSQAGKTFTSSVSISGFSSVPNLLLQPSANSAGVIHFKNPAASGNYNFLIGAQWNIGNAFEITSSTATDGSTFSTPCVQVEYRGMTTIGNANTTGAHTIQNSSTASRTLNLSNNSTSTSADGLAALLITKGSSTTTTAQQYILFGAAGGGTLTGSIVANGVSTAAFATASDERLKKNIQPLTGLLDKICALRPVEFDYIEGGHQHGFIAQEMQAIFPDAVTEMEFPDPGELSAGASEEEKIRHAHAKAHHENYHGKLRISGWDKTTARLVGAIKELKAQIDDLKAQIDGLKKPKP